MDKKYLTMKIDDILFNGKSFGYCDNKGKPQDGCFLTADTGLSYFAVPNDYLDILKQKKISEAQMCDPKSRIGNFTIVVGNEKIDVQPSDWQRMPVF